MNKKEKYPEMNEDDLSHFAPELARQSRENPFSVPAGYFDAMEAEVVKRISAIPGPESQSVENPFSVPEGYFEALPSHIQERIAESRRKRNPVTAWVDEIFYKPIPKYSLIAACVAIVLIVSVLYFNRTEKVNYVDVRSTDSEQLDAAFLTQLDESVLSDVLEEDLTAAGDVGDQGVENYLIDNDIDLSSLSEQF